MSSRQVSLTICQKMNDRILDLVKDGLYSDRQDMINTAIRNHKHTLLESTAECMMFYGILRDESGGADNVCRADRVSGQMAKFVTASFDGSGLLDVYEYYYPGQELNVRVNVRIPDNLLGVWEIYAPYSGYRKTTSNYIRDCIVMELLRIDEDARIFASVKMMRDGNIPSQNLEDLDEEIRKILEGRHGYIFNHCKSIATKK